MQNTASTHPTTPVPPPVAHQRLCHAKALAALREADRHLASAAPRLAALTTDRPAPGTPTQHTPPPSKRDTPEPSGRLFGGRHV